MNTLKSISDFVIARLSENSTWRGIILLLTGAGVAISPERAAAITAAGLSIVGLINVLRQGAPTKAQVAEALETKAEKPL